MNRVFTFSGLKRSLEWAIQKDHITHLKQWTHAPLFQVNDVFDISKIIHQLPQSVIDKALPTLDRPYYRYHLNYKEKSPEWYLIYWLPLSRSKIHNHPNGGCYWWLLDGELMEETLQETKILKSDMKQICFPNYAGDDKNFHRIINGKKASITLHVYHHFQ